MKKEKNMLQSKKNKEIIVITYIFAIAFLILAGNLIRFMIFDSEETINNTSNPRQEILAKRNTRGKIYSSDGKILAETIVGENRKEKRVYPYETIFAHSIGYSTNGKMGVELLANFQLLSSDTPISEKVQNDISDTKNPGNNAITTLDTKIQEVAYKALGSFKGAVVVMEVQTGKVLALVSKPDFNPNEIDILWDDLLQNDESSVLLNRATQGLYPPGSTFKIVTSLEYMRQNPDTFQNYTYQCNGRFILGEDRINCYHGSNHGSVDFKKSFSKSCNSSFANMGSLLEKEQFEQTLEELLFHQELPFKLPTKKSALRITQETSKSDMLQLSIGQGKAQVTPLHLAMITSAIANDGVLMTPYIVDRVENSRGTVIKQYGKKEYATLMTKEESSNLKEFMEEVVASGTGTKLKGLSYTAAGKTGSAEYNGTKTDSHAWFTGFAPVENPEIVVTIIIEGAGSGGDYAVPLTKRIFDAYFNE